GATGEEQGERLDDAIGVGVVFGEFVRHAVSKDSPCRTSKFQVSRGGNNPPPEAGLVAAETFVLLDVFLLQAQGFRGM
ncbi:MAG: hypothetical protein RLZZ23_1849, partial [Verrucomicrobiota bacterium]